MEDDKGRPRRNGRLWRDRRGGGISAYRPRQRRGARRKEGDRNRKSIRGERERNGLLEREGEWLPRWSIVHDALGQRGSVAACGGADPPRERAFRLVYKRLALDKLTPLHFRRSQRTSLGEVVANQRPSFRGPRPQADSTSPVPNVGCRR